MCIMKVVTFHYICIGTSGKISDLGLTKPQVSVIIMQIHSCYILV